MLSLLIIAETFFEKQSPFGVSFGVLFLVLMIINAIRQSKGQ